MRIGANLDRDSTLQAAIRLVKNRDVDGFVDLLQTVAVTAPMMSPMARPQIVKTQAAGVSDVLGQTRAVKRGGPACPCGSYSVEVVEGDQIKRRGFCKSCPLSESPEHSAKEEPAQGPERLS